MEHSNYNQKEGKTHIALKSICGFIITQLILQDIQEKHPVFQTAHIFTVESTIKT